MSIKFIGFFVDTDTETTLADWSEELTGSAGRHKMKQTFIDKYNLAISKRYQLHKKFNPEYVLNEEIIGTGHKEKYKVKCSSCGKKLKRAQTRERYECFDCKCQRKKIKSQKRKHDISNS